MSWRPLLRIARRDVLRARGRSTLIVLMVMLPVGGVAFVDVMLRTTSIDTNEQLDLTLGRTADVRLMSQGDGEPVMQRPTDQYAVSVEAARQDRQPKPAVDPTSLLPRGSRWITDTSSDVMARTTDGLTRASFREYAYTDPIAEGTLKQTAGAPPRSRTQVVVTQTMLRTLGLSVGDNLELTRPAGKFTIVGTYLAPPERPRNEVTGLPGALGVAGRELRDDRATAGQVYLVDTPAPFSWKQVLALNKHGIAAYSRYVVEHPPPDSAVPFYASDTYRQDTSSNIGLYLALTLIVGLAVLEVTLLAGAAFAVGARRQSRALGLLAATGGTAGHVRAVVLAQGLVLGAAGGAVGIGLGVLSALGAIPLLTSRFDAALMAADVRPLELAGLLVLGMGTGLAAAILPARAAARQDVVAALRGRRGVIHTRRRLPVIGLIVAATGTALAVGGGALALGLERSGRGGALAAAAVLAILVGAVLTQLGLIAATPAIVGAVGRLGRFLPLSPRLAVRDAARHRGRTAPAVAAVLGAVAGSVALTLYVSSLSAHDREAYQPTIGYGQYAVDTWMPPEGEPPNDYKAKIAGISRVAPPFDTFQVKSVAEDCGGGKSCRVVHVGRPKASMCPSQRIATFDGVEPTEAQQRAAETDPRCQFQEEDNFASRFNGPVVGSYRDFVRLTGLRSQEARRALDGGGMVVFSRSQVSDGVGYLDIHAYDAQQAVTAAKQVEVPAAYVDARGKRFIEAFLSPAAAAKAGARTRTAAIVLAYRSLPDDDTEERVRAELARIGQEEYFQVERGYRDRYGPGLLALLLGSAVITLGAAGVATGLAQADARADHASLAAVGAPPRVRRALAAWQAGMVAGLGAVLGMASGFVPTTAYLYADPEYSLVLPWRNLGLITLIIPAVAALAAWLLTRSRLPLERRLEV